MVRQSPISTRTATLVPDTTPFRSASTRHGKHQHIFPFKLRQLPVAARCSVVVLEHQLGDPAIIDAVTEIEHRLIRIGTAVGIFITAAKFHLGFARDRERPVHLVGRAGYADTGTDRKSTRLNSSPSCAPRMPSSA